MSYDYTELRRTLLRLRAEQDPQAMQRGALLIRGRLFTWLNEYRKRLEELNKHPQTLQIAAYWPLENEIDLTPLLWQWAALEGIQLSLPCVTAENSPLVFKPWNGDTPMKTAAYGIQEPDTENIAPAPHIMLVPTLGFTRTGDRMGYGKGYYDRTLAQLQEQNKEVVTIGIGWATGDLSAHHYTAAEHDQPLHSVLTDKGWAVPAPSL